MNNEDKILKVVFENPYDEFHMRLLARMTKLHPNTVINITDSLAKKGYVIKKKDKQKNMVLVKANNKNWFYKVKKQYFNIKKIYSSGLIDFLNEKLDYPAIILFGSYAKAENHKGSDIDLFIVTSTKKRIDLSNYEKKLGAEIQLFVHTRKEFKKLIKTNPELINNVINGYKLSGFLEIA